MVLRSNRTLRPHTSPLAWVQIPRTHVKWHTWQQHVSVIQESYSQMGSSDQGIGILTTDQHWSSLHSSKKQQERHYLKTRVKGENQPSKSIPIWPLHDVSEHIPCLYPLKWVTLLLELRLGSCYLPRRALRTLQRFIPILRCIMRCLQNIKDQAWCLCSPYLNPESPFRDSELLLPVLQYSLDVLEHSIRYSGCGHRFLL